MNEEEKRFEDVIKNLPETLDRLREKLHIIPIVAMGGMLHSKEHGSSPDQYYRIRFKLEELSNALPHIKKAIDEVLKEEKL